MGGVCDLRITAGQLSDIEQNEAVVLDEWENSSGQRWGELRFTGSLSDCRESLSSSQGELLIVPNGVKYIGSQVVQRDDLLPPKA